MKALFNWLDDRTGYRHLVYETLYEPIPGGARWRYVWGSTLVFTFAVQVVTGMLLWTAYSPSAQSAWESVYYIEHVMQYGWILRGIHHFTASAMVVLMGLHFLQVVVDSAYRAPREVNFWLGIVLLQIVLGLALTGYLLPWDQKGYYATRVATKIAGVTPVVGDDVQVLIQGGPDYGHHTLTRFFALHAGILPALLVVFLALHVYVFRRHAITPAEPTKNPRFAAVLTLLFGPVGMVYSNIVAAIVMALLLGGSAWGLYWLRQEGHVGWDDYTLFYVIGGVYLVLNLLFAPWAWRSARDFFTEDAHFWPDQILKDAVACLAVLATVLGLTFYFDGAELTAPVDPSEDYSAARPEWYFLFLFQFLKIEAVGRMGEVFGAIVVPGIIMAIIIAMPIVGRWKLGHRFNVAYISALMLAVVVLTGMAYYEDYHDEDFQYAKAAALREGERTVELASAFGIPPEGAGALLRSDPKTQGAKLFARKCASCHRWNGRDGTGRPIMELADKTQTVGGQQVVVTHVVHGERVPVQEERPAEPTATDLANAGSREWVRSLLLDFREHFSAVQNLDSEAAQILLNGDMASWSDASRDVLSDPRNERHLNALVEFLVAQSGREHDPPIDPDLVELGRKVFEEGSSEGVLAEGALAAACTDCHSIKPAGEEEVIGTTDYAPDLTGYMGQEWLGRFIRNPENYYSQGNNAMPAFGEATLTDEELDLLVRWMTRDYYEPEE
ncbi:MAG: cytochrome b N-terminal domain-containing protein [Planctomycetaceae bacterium]